MVFRRVSAEIGAAGGAVSGGRRPEQAPPAAPISDRHTTENHQQERLFRGRKGLGGDARRLLVFLPIYF